MSRTKQNGTTSRISRCSQKSNALTGRITAGNVVTSKLRSRLCAWDGHTCGACALRRPSAQKHSFISESCSACCGATASTLVQHRLLSIILRRRDDSLVVCMELPIRQSQRVALLCGSFSGYLQYYAQSAETLSIINLIIHDGETRMHILSLDYTFASEHFGMRVFMHLHANQEIHTAL